VLKKYDEDYYYIVMVTSYQNLIKENLNLMKEIGF